MKTSEAHQRSTPPTFISSPPAGRQRQLGPILMGSSLLLLALTGSWASRHRLVRYESEIDGEALRTAHQSLERSLTQQRDYLLSQVAVLAEDNRIRATVTMAKPDEATISDVLNDLKTSANAKLLAVLDISGKVQAAVGMEGLRDIDLGHSAVVKAAFEHPASYVWTFPTEVLTVGVSPIRSRGELQAFLVMGIENGRKLLQAAKASPDVEGAIFTGDKLIASSTNDQSLLQALRSGARNEDGRDLVVDAGRKFLSRVTRINESVGAAKVVWIVPWHHHEAQLAMLSLVIWAPALAAFLMWVLLFTACRQRDGERS